MSSTLESFMKTPKSGPLSCRSFAALTYAQGTGTLGSTRIEVIMPKKKKRN